jgi:hypothetical protein
MIEEIRLKNNPRVIKTKLCESLLAQLKNNINASSEEANINNKQLIGQIEEEFRLDLSLTLQNFILKTAIEYQEFFDYNLDKSPVIVESWVNKQKKYEYNPVHNHRFSLAFVIWVDIPYDVKNENNYANSINSAFKRNSAFEFVYATLSGKIETHQIFTSKGESEGIMIMFPSQLKHTVYPFFTSDYYRISVAGNIDLV